MTRMAKSSAMCLAALVTLTFTALPARAETPLHRPVEVNFDGVSVQNALAVLGERAGVRFEYDADLMRGLHSVTYQAEDQEAGRVAMRILYPRGLELGEVRGNRVPVLKRDTYDELRPRREENYEFVRKPSLTREGDDVTITFETAGWCDVTVAIEDDRGTIIRHLASGVLGPNAPVPFVWNSRAQTLVWDGKDDKGEYVDDKDIVTVRVSLGLKPRFERTLFWHPGKMAGGKPAFVTSPEGIYVFSGRGFDHVRLFDRDGNYLRTVYPFPTKELAEIPDLIWHEFPDGPQLPIKPNYYQSTLLQSGRNANLKRYRDGRYQGTLHGGHGTFFGAAGQSLAVSGDRLAVIGRRVSRFTTTGGGVAGASPHGPKVALPLPEPWRGHWLGMPPEGSLRREESRPKRAAISPDGRWLYLTAYHERAGNRAYWQHRVMRMPFEGDEPPTVFAEAPDVGGGPGKFNMPADVACDSQGRVYVADHKNDRIQVFDAEGQFVESVATKRPARVAVHHRTDEIFVFSWGLPVHQKSRSHVNVKLSAYDRFHLTHFSSLDDGAEEQASWDLQSVTGWRDTRANLEHDALLDTESDPIRVWAYAPSPVGARRPSGRGLVLLALENGEWTVKRDLRDEAVRAIVRVEPPAYFRQRLFVNPTEAGFVYLAEPGGGTDAAMGFKRLLRMDLRTGRCRHVELPMTVEDMAFSPDGHAYLKLRDMVARYNPATWREVPFDYGEERHKASVGVHSGARSAHVQSGAVFPGGGRHHGGIHVCARGNIAVSAVYGVGPESRRDDDEVHEVGGYRTRLYPGRRFGQLHGVIQVHVLDRHGQLQHIDAVPGLTQHVYGTGIDERGDIYLLESTARSFDGQPYFNDLTGTVMKFTPGQARIRVPSGAPVPLTQKPERPGDVHIYGGSPWVEGAHWFYGGVGWGGFSGYAGSAGGCHCPNPRFVIDYFARSFTPEHHRYNVGVVDSNGNLILRVGQYGNVDDGEPLVKDSGPPEPRSIGGDEVALFDTRAVATHTDRRLFISDLGNARILSVKLGYHTEETVALKDVPDAGDPAN